MLYHSVKFPSNTSNSYTQNVYKRGALFYKIRRDKKPKQQQKELQIGNVLNMNKLYINLVRYDKSESGRKSQKDTTTKLRYNRRQGQMLAKERYV